MLARLRDAGPAGGLELQEIGDGLRRSGVDVGLPRLWAAIRSLEDDGLARTGPGRDLRPKDPPTAEAVAEERAAYGAGEEDLARVWVALP